MALVIEYTLNLENDYHVGSGQGVPRIADSLLVTDKLGRPYVPGDTIKGIVRDASYDLMDNSARSLSLRERCFGTAASEGIFRFSHAKLDADSSEILRSAEQYRSGFIERAFTRVRSFNHVEHETGRAMEDHLFNLQMADLDSRGLLLKGRIVHDGNEARDDDAALVVGCLRFVRSLGRRRRRGLGRCLFTGFKCDAQASWSQDFLVDRFVEMVGSQNAD